MAIGDNGKEQRLIRTLRRKGLRFVGMVREEQQARPALTRVPIASSTQQLSLSIGGVPAVVVLPFRNLSVEPGNDFAADGLTEEITAALSTFGWFSVISRNSVFGSRAQSIARRQLTDDFGVRYFLGGSVRQSGNNLRVAVQVVDAMTNHQIWNDRYDCRANDIFALQDEITAHVVEAIADQLYMAESARARFKTRENLTVWHYILRALSLINTRKKAQVAAAERLLKRAIAIDPKSAPTFSLLSFVRTLRVHLGWRRRTAIVPISLQIADYSLSLNTEEPWGHLARGYATLYERPEQAIGHLECAVKLNPKLATAYYLLALASTFTGDYESAFRHADMADRVKSFDLLARGNAGAHDNVRATSCFIAGRYSDGIDFARKVIKLSPRQTPAYRQLVTNCAIAGEIEEAKSALAIVKRLAPNVEQWIGDSFKSWSRREDFQKYVEGFRLAGCRELGNGSMQL